MDVQQAFTEAMDAVLDAPEIPQATADAGVTDTTEVVLPDLTQDVVPEVPVDPAEEVPEEEVPAEPEPVALPEGYVAVPIVEDRLATEFVLRDAEGEVEVPALIVEYRANGRVRQDRLDQVVKLAQFGVYNEERERKVQSVEREAVELKAEREALAKTLEDRELQMERLINDEEFFLSVRDAYARENSPEQRAARAEQEADELRTAAKFAPLVQEGRTFYEQEVTPALTLIAQQLPSVTLDELAERMTYALQAHVERGPNGQPFVPPSRHDAVRQYIVDDLAVWAQMQQARRQPAAIALVPDTRASKATQELAKAQVSAQKAKRAVGQATRPVGRAANAGPAAKKASQSPVTVDDALSSAMDEILSAFR
jgi:hypothetical protein